ncbi:unnamed protein product [Heligmosomoides polygyrus]|uniref:Polo_box_2 domain-containing protein n=1 Tax=Heligmosomoides polygyrus TaxID=6339 RepID=A0A183FKK4_HELPZ|nr:unnamed protein product [Heligmosomoides polygyrus]
MNQGRDELSAIRPLLLVALELPRVPLTVESAAGTMGSCAIQRRVTRWSASARTTVTRSSRADAEPLWPLPLHRCGGTRLLSAAGRYVIVDDSLMVFEVANKSGFIAKIVTISIDSHGRQQVTFDRPMNADVRRPLEQDALIPVDRTYQSTPLTSLTGSMLISAAGSSPYHGWVLTDLEDIADVTCGQTAPVV